MPNHHTFGRQWLVMVTLLSISCASLSCDDASPSEAERNAQVGAHSAMNTAPPPTVQSDTSERVPRVKSGLYSMGVALTEFGGLEVPFQVEIESRIDEGGRQVFEHFYVRAVKGDEVSEILADAGPVTVTDLGTFQANSGSTAMPADFSPTGSEVRLQFSFLGRIIDSEFVCGQIQGEILTLEARLEDSAFAFEPWDGRQDVAPAYCESQAEVDACLRIEAQQCPDIVDGLNENFISCGIARTFEVYLPSQHNPDRNWPVIYLYHHLGGSHVGLAAYTGLRSLVDEFGFILVVPSSTQLPVEWEQFSLRDNLDLAWFDDSLKCLNHQHGADLNRVYVTGQSAGGLYASYLALRRSDAIAAAAPMSGGGLIINYTPPARALPLMLSWGGPSDVAVEQNFDIFARNFITDLRSGGHLTIACDHGAGHIWDQGLNRAMLKFFEDHPLEGPTTPYSSELPSVFPPYCSLVE